MSRTQQTPPPAPPDAVQRRAAKHGVDTLPPYDAAFYDTARADRS